MPECAWLDDGETLTYLHSTRLDPTPARPRARNADVSRRPPGRRAPDRRAGAAARRRAPAHPHRHGLPDADRPGLLDDLNRLAFPYRWSTRAIMLDKTDATKLLTKIRRQWFAKRKSIAAILKEVMTNEASALLDTDAHNKAIDADAALQELGSDLDRRGLCHRDRHRLGRRSAHRRRKAAAGREGHPGPRLHLHARDASTRSRPGSAACRAMSTPMSASRRSRRSTSPT